MKQWLDARGITGMTLVVACVFVVLFGLSLAVMFFEWAHKSIASLVGVKEKYELLTFLGICKGGVLLLWQALSSHKRARAMEDAAQAQAAATRGQARSIEATEQGQRQERLKNAIEHLGHDSVSVRLGGAYELFHLAEDTEVLSKTALDILCAHIRRTTGEDKYQKDYRSKPSEEVQSLLSLLFVQDHQVFKDLPANLQGSFLNGADLSEAHLQGANLKGARLQGADLWRAYLQGAELHRAHLRGANLWVAHLQGAVLRVAHLQEADLSGAHLQGAELREAHLQGAVLKDARLQGADLWDARLQGADLWGARLQGAVLGKARLQGADLEYAHLQGSAWWETHLQAAKLCGADLRGAEMLWIDDHYVADRANEAIGRESNLSGVVSKGGLSQEDVDSLVKGLSGEKANELRSALEPHVGQEGPGDFPDNGGTTLGTYSKEEAEQWIAEYDKAMSEVPKKQ